MSLDKETLTELKDIERKMSDLREIKNQNLIMTKYLMMINVELREIKRFLDRIEQEHKKEGGEENGTGRSA